MIGFTQFVDWSIKSNWMNETSWFSNKCIDAHFPLNLLIRFFPSFFFFITVHGSENQYNQGGLVYQPQNQSDISPPVFEKIFKNARFAQGGNALFEGKLRGNPKPVVSWTRKGAPLLPSNKYQINYNEITGDVSALNQFSFLFIL